MKNPDINGVLLKICNESTPKRVEHLRVTFAVAFLVSVIVLGFSFVLAIVFAVCIGLGVRSLAERAAKKVNSDMLVQNSIEKLNRIFSKSNLITSFAKTLREMFLGLLFQLAASDRQTKATNLLHICLTHRFFSTPSASLV